MTTPSAWTYSGDPTASDKDEVRFLVQDTDSSRPLLSDAEIAYLIDRWQSRYDSNTYVASIAAATVSRKFAGVASIVADGVTVNVSDISQRYAVVAQQLRAEYAAGQLGGLVDITNVMIGAQLDDDILPLNFSIGMHDNVEAGQQAYGGRPPVPAIEWPGQ